MLSVYKCVRLALSELIREPGHTWDTVFSFDSCHQERCAQAGGGAKKGHKDDQRTGRCHRRKDWENWVCSALRKVLGDTFITVFQYLKGDYSCKRSTWKRGGVTSTGCSRGHSNRSQDNFSQRTVSHWNNLPRVVVHSPTLDTSKIWLSRLLDHLV